MILSDLHKLCNICFGSFKMKTLILLVSVGLVWGLTPEDLPNKNQEEITIFLTPFETKQELDGFVDKEIVKDDKIDKQTPIPTRGSPATTTTTEETPVAKNSIPIDLSQRLFFASYEDSQFNRKTLDLSDLDLTGEDVMKILHGLNSTTLDSITRLDLSHNRVWGLPSRIWPLQLEYSLQELRLDYNKLYIDESITQWSTGFELQRLLRLKKLSLSHCGLTSPLSLEYPQVESLDLSGNWLLDLPYSLAKLTKLQHLDVSGNNIRYLSGFPLDSITSLQILNLSNNHIERMWDEPIKKLYHLDTLYLDHNSLTEPPKLYQYTGSYQPAMTLYISNNSFRCGCSFKNTLDIGRVQIPDKSNVTCIDDEGVEWSVDSAPGSQCSPHWEAMRQKFSGAKEWFQGNLPGWSTLFWSLGGILIGVMLTLVYNHCRSKKNPPPSQVPYNILDDRAGC